MTLASYEDANGWLDGTKIAFDDDLDALQEATAADAFVKGRLSGSFPDHVDLWDYNPQTGEEPTPQLVREAASLLMASYRYSKVYSEEVTFGSNYAKILEQRAMALLDGIASGMILLEDVDYTSSLGFPSYYPNDQSPLKDDGTPDRLFTIDKVF